MTESNWESKQPPHDSQRSSSPFRFSLRTLLVVAVVVAAFLAGTVADRWPWPADPVQGSYSIRFPAGAQRDVSLMGLGEGLYQMQGGGVLNGVYQLKGDQLLMVRPVDGRMMGLAWRRLDEGWTLFREPVGTPTGSSYLSAKLSPKTKSASEPVIPSEKNE
ncbi:MAG: hypothetical protein ACR2NZ_25210 [Rubripirellula sp.]